MKFRVFDNQENKYPLESKKVFFLLPSGKLYDYDEGKEADPDRYVVEMSTGLKDKNGEEMFQGDTVKKHYEKHDITFEDGSFFLFGYPIREQKAYGFYKELEIIGNIHEAKQWIYR